MPYNIFPMRNCLILILFGVEADELDELDYKYIILTALFVNVGC